MMDFSTLQGLTIPEGVVTQIADAQGRVIWAVGGGKVILEVEKITSDTYAGETTYTGEQFILLDIYPKTNGTAKVTYGGLTKTITDTSGAEEPNAQQVFFGAFNGVTDEVETPVSGELIIEGTCAAFGCGSFQNGSKATNVGYCSCITAVVEWGGVNKIPTNAFYYCNKVDFSVIPEGVTSIGANAFTMEYDSTNGWKTPITSVMLPSTIESIGSEAFVQTYTFISGTTSYTGYRTYLKKIVVRATTPPTLGEHAFQNYNKEAMGGVFDTIVVVPPGCGDTYKAADGWSLYEIVEAS